MSDKVTLTFTQAELTRLIRWMPYVEHYEPPTRPGDYLRRVELELALRILAAARKTFNLTESLTLAGADLVVVSDRFAIAARVETELSKPAKATPPKRKRGRPRTHPRQTTIDEGVVDDGDGAAHPMTDAERYETLGVDR